MHLSNDDTGLKSEQSYPNETHTVLIDVTARVSPPSAEPCWVACLAFAHLGNGIAKGGLQAELGSAEDLHRPTAASITARQDIVTTT
jgi:hypothetical protein